MTQAVTCPQCGSELPSNAPAGMCPRCLMEAAFAESSDENQAPADSPYAETTQQPRSFLPPESGVLAAQFPTMEILELLGQGGMGAVYKARQPKLDRLVALKIIRPESADDPTFAERFNREARTLARLNHPNIVGVHDFGEVTLTDEESSESPKTLYYFLMEYVNGANLRQMMDRGDLSPAQALSIVPQICDALQFAHDEGIVHRDIKPENILVDSRGRVKIADFGLAKLASPSEQDFTLTETHQVMGTPRYMAPEQMAGSRAVDHRADLYSLGVVFYEMLTGQIPAGHFSPPSEHTAIDVRLDDVVMKALAPKPEDRFQNASEIRSRLEAISRGDSESVISDPEPPPARGFSTIFEREVGAAWNWIVRPETAKDESGKSATRAFPRLLFITLAVLGGLTMFLPWAEIHLDSDTVVSFIERGATLTAPVHQIYSGTSVWSSAAAGGLCFLLLIVLILIPHGRPPGLIAAGLLTLMSLGSFIHTLTYQAQMRTEESVVLPLEVHGREAVKREAMDKAGVWSSYDDAVIDAQEVASKVYRFSQPVSLRFPELFECVRYREGFYAALGFSLSLLLLNIVSVRNAILNREPTPKIDESWSGTPLASLRFQVPARGDLGSKVKFHFLGLGYELEKEQPGTWIFQRGTMMGGMMQSDIRAYPTRLSIHAIEEADGSHLVNCHWSVRLMGGWAGKKDIQLLEDEGRELQSLLGGPIGHPEPATAAPVPAEVSPPPESVLEPGEQARVAPADKEPMVSPSPTMDLSVVEDEVRGPAVAMMVVGLLMIVGHVIAIPVMLEVIRSDDFIWMAFPGMLVGVVMLVGGIGLHALRSLTCAQVGIVAGFLPVTPAWIFTVMVSTWARNVLSKPQVKMGFTERRRRQREELKRWSPGTAGAGPAIDLLEVEDEVSGPAIAMIVVGSLMIVGSAIWALIIGRLEERLFFPVPGALIGFAMLVGGLAMKSLGSRGWAQMGAIAGMIPVHPGWILSLLTGIWALVTLRRPKIRRAFLERARQRREPAIRKQTLSETGPAAIDLVDIEEEVSSPAIAMMVVGLLMIVGHGIAFGIYMSTPWDREMAWIAVPGFIIGLGMLVAGINLKGLRSRGWAQLGIIAGFIPGGPGWLLSFPISIWANKVFNKSEIKQAFLERARRSRSQPVQQNESQSALFRPRVLIGLAVWSILVIIGGMVSYAWLRGELSETRITDNRAGTLVPKSGAYENVTVTAKGVLQSKLVLGEDDIKRTHLEFQLTPLKYADYGGGTGLLEIELPTLGWRAPLRDTTEIVSPVGLTPNSVKEWMGLSGVDLNVEGVAEEARSLFAIAEYAHQRPPHELIDHSLFTVQPGAPNQVRAVTVRYGEWEHARYCLYVWLAGLGVVVLVIVVRAGREWQTFGSLALKFLVLSGLVIGLSFLTYMMTERIETAAKIPTSPPAERKPADDLENPLPALHDAAAVGQISRVRRLLADVNADINDKDFYQGKTPLMYAAQNNQKSTVLALIVMGANIEETDSDGRNAFMLAADKGQVDLLQKLRELQDFAEMCHRDNATPEQAAERFKEFPGIDRRLLEEINPRALKFEVPLDAQDNQGMTVAMIAAANGDITTLETLWNMGGIGDDNRQDHQGRTLLMHAMLNGHSDLVLTFLERFVKTDPAELSPLDEQGRSLYSLAEEQGATEVAGRMRELLTEEVERYTKLVETEPDYQPYLTKLLKAFETTN